VTEGSTVVIYRTAFRCIVRIVIPYHGATMIIFFTMVQILSQL